MARVQTDTATQETPLQATAAARTSLRPSWLDLRLLLLVIAALLAGALAYQAPVALRLMVGQLGDQLFLPRSQALDQSATDAGRWYGDEPTDHAPGGRSRWTRQYAQVDLPGMGAAGPLELTVSAQGWPADALNPKLRQPLVTVLVNGAPAGSFTPKPEWDEYPVRLPAQERAGDTLSIRLESSGVFTSTRAFADARPKGLRVAAIGLRSAEGLRLRAPAPLPLALLLLSSLLAALALRLLTGRGGLAFAGGLAVALLGALGLALARPWAAALLPWAAALLGALALLGARRALARLLRGLAARFAHGHTLDLGIAAALLAWLLMLAAGLPRGLLSPEALRESFPESLTGLLLALALAALAALRGHAGLPRLTRALVRALGGPRCAPLLMVLFLAVWLSYEAAVIAWLPYVGHADYADNAVVARNLAAGRGWVVDYVTQFYHLNPGGSVTRPQETWPLLQPVWIAPFFALLGPSNWAAKIPNLIFTLALGLAVYRIGARLWDLRAGLTAAVLLLTSRWFFFLVIYTTTDLAFTLFALGAVWLLYRAADQRPTTDDQRLVPDERPATDDQGPAPDEGRRTKDEIGASASLSSTQDSPTALPPYRSTALPLLGSALLTGLMMLQKPSGGLVALGMGLWLVWRALRAATKDEGRKTKDEAGAEANLSNTQESAPAPTFYRSTARLLPAAAWALVALLVLSPYLARNLAVFGRPFASTESYDAWVLGYSDWEDIYKVYTPEQGLSETQGLPERSWVLRWGFDRTLFKLATQVRAVRDYLAPPWRDLPLDLSDLVSGRDGRALLAGVGSWLGLLGLLGLLRHRAGLAGLLLLAFGPYTLFLITYWHADEQRYFVVLMPWLALLAARALWRIYDRIAAAGRGGWAPLGLALVAAALLAIVRPSWDAIADKVGNEPQIHTADLAAYAWLREHTAPGDVVMTRNPWQLNWAAERPALMVPNTPSTKTMLALARYYRAHYLVRDSVQNPSQQAIATIDTLIKQGALTLVYTTPPQRSLNDRGEPQQLETRIYRFAPEATAERDP